LRNPENPLFLFRCKFVRGLEAPTFLKIDNYNFLSIGKETYFRAYKQLTFLHTIL